MKDIQASTLLAFSVAATLGVTTALPAVAIVLIVGAVVLVPFLVRVWL